MEQGTGAALPHRRCSGRPPSSFRKATQNPGVPGMERPDTAGAHCTPTQARPAWCYNGLTGVLCSGSGAVFNPAALTSGEKLKTAGQP